ncbi:hypothetical protein J7U46_01440 [Pelomonas sp. V22]|uniref:hypothetical protein n=1 Tax=Pelomonas sp. V22 TaxID=2822139 RepID=UPI0024A98E03|nr:hypothetical protein [Pelomonas sp. V22]MDI4631704.1 hypothetical protein [Pelomonas sp. V22]
MLRKLALGLAGVGSLLVAAELLLRLLPVSTATLTGYYVDPLILSYPPGHSWQVSTGWDLRNSRRMSANNLGFAAEIDFARDPNAIGLIGDSYVEASMLDAKDRPAAQLAAALPSQRPVYALGGPGSALLDYAERIRFASEKLGLRDFVVLMESGDLRQSLCGSGNVHGPCLDRQSLQPRIETQPGPSAAKRWLRHSALAQYLAGQLKVDVSRLPAQAFAGASHDTVPSKPVPAAVDEAQLRARRLMDDAMVAAVVERFFERIKPYATGRLVFVVDGRRDALAAASPQLLDRDAFVVLARQRGFTVVDAEPLYQQHSAASKLSLSVSPQDGHLNPLGVGLLMQAAAQALP